MTWIRTFRTVGAFAGILALVTAIGIWGCNGNSSRSPSPTPVPSIPTSIPPTPTPTPSPTPVNSISGKVEGGLGPISGAQVTLYQAGNSAYGAGATVLGTATTDSRGKFAIGFTPPATPTLLYLVALGGNAGAGSNAAIGLMGVAGPSNAPLNAVKINELTTVAGQWALPQFIDSTGQEVGAPLSNRKGILNAAAQALDNLADTATGAPAKFLPTALECSSGLPAVNCDGLDRLDTLANIIAACVQSSGPSTKLPSCALATNACDILLACSGTPAIGTALGAAHAIATHPTSNVSQLFAAQGAVQPFQPALVAAPDGFEIALNLFPLAARLSSPIGVAADIPGDVWIANLGGNSVTKLSAIGRFIGTFAPAGAKFDQPYGIAINANNDVWISNSNGASVTELNAVGGLIANRSPAGADINEPTGVEVDQADNVWVANFAGNSVSELLSIDNYATGVNYAPPGAAFDGPAEIGIDTGANVWVSNFTGNSVSELTASSSYAQGLNFAPGAALLNFPVGLGLDAANNVWIANSGSLNISELTASSSYSTGFSFSPAGAALNEPAALKFDSAGNLWATDVGTGTLSELLAGCSSVSCNGLKFDPPGADLNSPQGVTVDAAGNIWVASTGNNSIAEFIGLAAPTGVPVLCLEKSQTASCLP